MPRANLAVSDTGAYLLLADEQSRTRAEIKVSNNNAVHFKLSEASGQPRVDLSLHDGQIAGLSLWGPGKETSPGTFTANRCYLEERSDGELYWNWGDKRHLHE